MHDDRPLSGAERPRPLVLVVEDEPDIRQFLVGFLTDEGYDVVEARDGLEGLAALAARTPDVIILDLFMPRLNGAEFVAHYRATPGPHAPVIVASASSKYLGVPLPPADAYANKPFDIDQLLSLLATFTAQELGAPPPESQPAPSEPLI